LRPQRISLLGRELEREVLGKAFPVAAILFVQPFGGHAIQRREIRIEDHPDATNCINPLLNEGEIGFRHWVMIQFGSRLVSELITICDAFSDFDIAICDLKESNSSRVS
jgi:hypothetical protein